MTRNLIRSLLILVLVVSVYVILLSLQSVGPKSPEAWATAAAGLAVITSVISAWSAQRVVEQQEDLQRPFPYPTIDIQSRIHLILLRVVNFGGSPAFDIYLKWDEPIPSLRGGPTRFNRSDDGGPEIDILLPKESISVMIDSQVDFYKKQVDENKTYSGTIIFKTASGTQMQHRFSVSISQHKSTLTHDNERSMADYKIQDLPGEIQKLTAELHQIRYLMHSKRPD